METQILNVERLLNLVTLLSLLGVAGVLYGVRREHIRVEYSVSWLVAAVVLFTLGRWRALDEWLAGAVGVGNVALVLVMLAGSVFLVVLYRLSLLVSGLKDSNIKLTQRVAFLEFQLEHLDEKTRTQASR